MSDSSSDEDNDINEEKITQEFVEFVKSWVKLDDEIREYNDKIKELKKEKKEYETFVLEYMEKIGEKSINITGGKLRQNKSKTKTALKQEVIQGALYELTKDSAKSLQMTKYIMDKRPTVERVNLKRTRNRKKKKKKNINNKI